MRLRDLWDMTMGTGMTLRLMKWIVPGLVWNQQVYGTSLQRYISGDTRWLDLGCGHRLLGNDLEPIEDGLVASARTVVGCDVDFPSIREHRSIRTRVLGSADLLPFRDGSFDVVTCNMVVEHLSDPVKAFSEMARVLKPGGRIIVHTPNLMNYAVFLNHTVMRWIPRKHVLALVTRADERREADVFVTFYRANTAGRLAGIVSGLGLKEESRRFLPPPRPFLGFFAPFALVQLLLMRLTMSPRFQRFGATMLMVFKLEAANSRSRAATA